MNDISDQQDFIIDVPDLETPIRLDKFLSDVPQIKEQHISRMLLQKLMSAGHITFMGKAAKASMRLKGGEQISVHLPEPQKANPQPVNIPIDILYEDDDIIVVNKHVGLTVHPAAGHHDDTLVNALLYHCADTLSSIGGVLRPGIVHRLDKDTSGVMVVAKNDKAHQYLSHQFSEHSIGRRYEAICYHSPKTQEGTIVGNIARSTYNRQKMAVVTSGGKEAVTYYKTLKQASFKDYLFASFIEFTLETGRTHQIRLHAAHSGFAVLGDPVYGSLPFFVKKLPTELKNAINGYKTQALHAAYLGFKHPTTEEFIEFTAAPPEPYQDIYHLIFNEDVDEMKDDVKPDE